MTLRNRTRRELLLGALVLACYFVISTGAGIRDIVRFGFSDNSILLGITVKIVMGLIAGYAAFALARASRARA